MPLLNPLEDGDNAYPQYAVTITQGLTIGILLNKGQFYTKDVATGLIIVSNPATFATGLYQSRVTTTIASVIDDEAQFFSPRTRMIRTIKDGEVLVEGQDVSMDAVTGLVIAGAKSDALYLGKIFEIYTRNNDLTNKKVTVNDDQVIIETVGN